MLSGKAMTNLLHVLCSQIDDRWGLTSTVVKEVWAEVNMKAQFWCRISLVLTILALTLYNKAVEGQRAGKFCWLQLKLTDWR